MATIEERPPVQLPAADQPKPGQVNVNPQNVITVLRRKLNEAQLEASMWEAAFEEMKQRAETAELALQSATSAT